MQAGGIISSITKGPMAECSRGRRQCEHGALAVFIHFMQSFRLFRLLVIGEVSHFKLYRLLIS